MLSKDWVLKEIKKGRLAELESTRVGSLTDFESRSRLQERREVRCLYFPPFFSQDIVRFLLYIMSVENRTCH